MVTVTADPAVAAATANPSTQLLDSGTTINVQDYGADPTDTTTDDSSAIQTALNAASTGDTVYIPGVDDPSTEWYVLDPSGTNALNINSAHNGVTITGDGDSSLLRMTDRGANNYRAILLAQSANDLTDIRIEKLRIDGRKNIQTGSPTAAHGIVIGRNTTTGTPEDAGLVLTAVTVERFDGFAFILRRGARARYCAGVDSRRGFSCARGRNNGFGFVNRVEYSETSLNSGVGFRLGGKTTVENCYSVADQTGYQFGADADVSDTGSGHIHRLSNVRARNSRSSGVRQVSPIEELHLTDVYVDGCIGYGVNLTQTTSLYVRGNGIKTENTPTSSQTFYSAMLLGGSISFLAVDEFPDSVLRVDDTNDHDAVSVNESAPEGVIDELKYNAIGTGTAVDYEVGVDTLTITTETSTATVGSVDYPATSEVGPGAYSPSGTVTAATSIPSGAATGVRALQRGDRRDQSETVLRTTGVGVLRVGTNGILSTVGVAPAEVRATQAVGAATAERAVGPAGTGITVSANAATGAATAESASLSTTGASIIDDFEDADLAEYVGVERGSVVSSTTAKDGQFVYRTTDAEGFSRIVAYPNATSEDLSNYLDTDQTARFHVRNDANQGTIAILFGASSEDEWYSVSVRYTDETVGVHKSSTTSGVTTLNVQTAVPGGLELGKWYQIEVERGPAGGSG